MAMPTDIGIVDLGIGFPYQSIEEKKAAYDFFRPLLKDAQSQAARWSSRPSTCSRTCPTSSAPDVDPVAVDRREDGRVQHRDRDAPVCRPTRSGPRPSIPDRFHLDGRRRPQQRRWRRCAKMEQAKAEHDIVAVSMLPVRAWSRRWRSTTRRCTRSTRSACELDIPICINGGIVGPRMPSWPQHVEHFDEVLYDFPELTMVMMHGGEPWTALR